ncbi:BYS1 domain protein [Aspergillus terreus]|uniref:BYS1 domain protein n=1 Tax=Aspergillus terreus TaxID=33178 RepID=A0A5M3ZDT4_ASPTE|nr:hypothetical protein ATETN484_0014032600 [Aspergillus terreus]GFF20992.1 BYS1 domain protein [Aspergillus terreus]
MHFSTLSLLSLAALSPLAQAVGNAVVKNNCNYPVYLWSVGGSVGPKQTIQPGASYSEPFRRDAQSGGISLKITRVDDSSPSNHPQVNYAYTLDGSNVWYDMSDVFGDPFKGTALVVKPSDTGCQSICWPNGIPLAGSQVKVCQANSNEVLTLCAPGC